MQSGLQILSWSFWSPETRVPRDWATAVAGPSPQALPDRAIPALHRRRMSALSKMAVGVALEATAEHGADLLVFCSQHGELHRTRELLAAIVAGAELSPASFSQSVHNASAGLYTIITASGAPATSLAAGAGTFAYAWLEAEAQLAEEPDKRMLMVSYDEPLPEEYRPYSAQTQRAHALALVLCAAESNGLTLARAAPRSEEPRPLAPLFMAWALSRVPALEVTAGGQGWVWNRARA